MERLFQKLRPKRPHETLKDTVLGPARRELLRLEAAVSFIDRVWSSKAFWATAAAAFLICVCANLFYHEGHVTSAVARAQDQPTRSLAKELAESLGDGPVREAEVSLL